MKHDCLFDPDSDRVDIRGPIHPVWAVPAIGHSGYFDLCGAVGRKINVDGCAFVRAYPDQFRSRVRLTNLGNYLEARRARPRAGFYLLWVRPVLWKTRLSRNILRDALGLSLRRRSLKGSKPPAVQVNRTTVRIRQTCAEGIAQDTLFNRVFRGCACIPLFGSLMRAVPSALGHGRTASAGGLQAPATQARRVKESAVDAESLRVATLEPTEGEAKRIPAPDTRSRKGLTETPVWLHILSRFLTRRRQVHSLLSAVCSRLHHT